MPVDPRRQARPAFEMKIEDGKKQRVAKSGAVLAVAKES